MAYPRRLPGAPFFEERFTRYLAAEGRSWHGEDTMQDVRWLFFDLGNTLISEEAATDCRIRQLGSSFEQHGRRYSVEEVRCALEKASAEFAPRLITGAIEKLTDDPELRKLIEAEAQYPKELEAPYEGAEQTLRTLSSRYILLPA
jgi:FMN phosphatase YigB (HAD superfamily)